MADDTKTQNEKPAYESSSSQCGDVVKLPVAAAEQEPIPKGYSKAVAEMELHQWFAGGIPPLLLDSEQAKCLDRLPFYGYQQAATEKVQYLKVDREAGTCEFVSKETVVSGLMSMWAEFGKFMLASRMYVWSLKQTEAMAPGLMKARLFKGEVLATGYKKQVGEDGICFHRYPFLPIKMSSYFPGNFSTIKNTAPIFVSFLKRMKNAQALCHVMGAALCGRPIRKLAPLIYGEPGCGKSMFLSVIREIFGPGWTNFPRNWKDTFAMASLENKMAWGIDEVDSNFVNSEMFKQITGSDTIEIRKPYQGAFDAKITGNFYMNCNDDKLFVYNNRAIIEERIVPCKLVGRVPASERLSVNELLVRIGPEMPFIHGYCMDVFDAGGSDVERDLSDLLEVVENTEADLEAVFDQYFTLCDEAVGHKTEVSLMDFRMVLNEIVLAHPSLARQRNFEPRFKKYFASKLGRPYYSANVKILGAAVKMVPGVKLK